MDNCDFCSLSAIETYTISRNDFALAFPTKMPITPGHTLICPVRHAGKMADLTPQEQVALLDLAEKIKIALKTVYGAEGFNCAWNEGEVAGQAVPHLHLHVVPRKKGDAGIIEYEPRKFLYRPGSRETTPVSELQVVAQEIKNALKG